MKKYLSVAIVILLIVIADHFNVSLTDNSQEDVKKVSQKQGGEQARVSHIVDGDTCDLSTGERKRLIGIDTPERGRLFYKEATQHLAELILDKDVILIKDVSETDRYGRLLRHVYVGGEWINKKMIEDGYARLVTYPPDVLHVEEFQEVELQARIRKNGIWSLDEEKVYGKK